MIKNDISITEIFYSLQGEGPYIGTPTVFVRVFGCNMKEVCPWCDTMYSVQKQDDTIRHIPIETVVNTILQYKCNNVTFTGGEPFLYKDQIKNIMWMLTLNNDFEFCFETNGMISDIIDFHPYKVSYVVSPKLHALKNNESYLDNIKNWARYAAHMPVYFKFVYENESSIEEIKKLSELTEIKNTEKIYLMPEGKTFSIDKYKECAEQCLKHHYKMSPRLHTIIWGITRGV